MLIEIGSGSLRSNARCAGKAGEIVIEILSQLDANHVRGIALTPTQGLARGMPVEVSFVLSEDETRRFLEMLQAENIDLFYVRYPVEYGFLPE